MNEKAAIIYISSVITSFPWQLSRSSCQNGGRGGNFVAHATSIARNWDWLNEQLLHPNYSDVIKNQIREKKMICQFISNVLLYIV